MSTILVVGQSTKHFSYYESCIRELEKRGNHIVFRYDNTFSSNKIYPALSVYLEESADLEFKWLVKPGVIRYFIYFLRELKTYSWYLSRTDQSKYYTDRWADLFPLFFPYVLKANFVIKIIKYKKFRDILGYIEKLIPVSRSIIKDIKSVRPDLIIASPANMRYSSEIDYIKAAKTLEIISIISVLSWDNLTNKGLFHAQPDYYFVWNKYHKEELKSLHDVAENDIRIIGAQLFDKWNNSEMNDLSVSYELKDLLDSPYLLYLGSSSNIAKNEDAILEKLSVELNVIDSNKKIIFKPHPAHYENYRHKSIPGVVLLPDKYGLSETGQDIANFTYLVRTAICVVGLNTSGFLDSVIIGKKTYAIISIEHKDTQKLSAHYRLLSRFNVIKEVNTVAEMLDDIQIKGAFSSNREQFIMNFVRPHGLDTSAGCVAANIIRELNSNIS